MGEASHRDQIGPPVQVARAVRRRFSCAQSRLGGTEVNCRSSQLAHSHRESGASAQARHLKNQREPFPSQQRVRYTALLLALELSSKLQNAIELPAAQAVEIE